MAATLDAVTGISPEYKVKNRKQVLNRRDGLNTGLPTAMRDPDGARPAEVNGTLVTLPARRHWAVWFRAPNMAIARHSVLAVPGGSPNRRGYPWTVTRLP